MKFLEKIYPLLPIPFQNLACTFYGFREGRQRFSTQFFSYLEEFVRTEWMPGDEVVRYKAVRLAALLSAAKENAFYAPKLSFADHAEISRDPYGVLQNLPVLKKEDIIEFFELIAHPRRRSTSTLVHTSGTTGMALQIYKTQQDTARQWAIWYRHRKRFGVALGDSSVNFTGKLVIPPSQKGPPFWRHNRAQHQYLINMQHITSTNIGAIAGFLNSISPVFYSGYPSILAEVSRLALHAGISLRPQARPRVIFCGAENVLDYQREAMVEWTGAVVTDQYGLTEGNCNFSRCEHGWYHEDFEMCHIEILDDEDAGDGKRKGKLVGTALFNDAFPLIRYHTGDMATIMPADYRCACGRKSQVLESVQGRIDDYVLTPEGKRIMRFDYLFKDTFDVRETQVVQERLGEVLIKSVLREGAVKSVYEATIRERVATWISPDLDVRFAYVDTLPKSITGKHKAVMNLIGKEIA